MNYTIEKNVFSVHFKNKNIFITGSSKGIGKALAKGFTELGANVIIHGKEPQLVQELAEELGCPFIVADLSVHEEVEHIIAELLAMDITLHVLINNAGIDAMSPCEELAMEDYDKVQHVNVRSPLQLAKGLFPIIEKNAAASIINISSVHQLLPYSNNIAYCMSKAAMHMFTKVLAMEWAPYTIRVNAVAPGAILTDMNKPTIEEIGYGKLRSWIGSGKIGDVKEVFSTCVYLASDMSSYMTGETMYIDGGLSKGLLPYGITPAMQSMKDRLLSQGTQ